MARGTSLIRCLTVLNRLERGYYTLEDLAAEFNVHPRTIRRDLIALQEAHKLIRNYTGDEGRMMWTAR